MDLPGLWLHCRQTDDHLQIQCRQWASLWFQITSGRLRYIIHIMLYYTVSQFIEVKMVKKIPFLAIYFMVFVIPAVMSAVLKLLNASTLFTTPGAAMVTLSLNWPLKKVVSQVRYLPASLVRSRYCLDGARTLGFNLGMTLFLVIR